MWQVRSAQTPFLTRKRSFDLAWGAWAGILAVMTAVGAALAGSQILMMFPREVQTIVFKYPSLPKADSASPIQFDDETPAIFWSKDGIVLGRIADISAPVRSGELLLKTGDPASLGLMFDSIQEWSSRNLSEPVRHIAIAQSLNKQSLNFSQIAEVIEMFEKINLKLFNAEGVVPSVVPVELANPL